jgi:circadian clock protein KaiB
MKTPPPRHTTTAFEHALAAQRTPVPYVLRLYVAGATARSARTIVTIKTACETHLVGHYNLQIIDIYQQPHLARQEHIVAVPLLVKQEPAPQRRLVGDLSDGARLLAGLDIPVGEAI